MKKERSVLKTYFATNKIPTADNFGELIDSAFNQAEDGIKKDAGNPVSIQAEGMGDGVQDLLYFYKNFNDANPSWRINQNPRTNPQDPTTNKTGLNVSDSAGVSRLFIKSDDGSIGLGTITPSQKLSVNGNALFGISDNTALGMDAQDQARLGIIKKFGSSPQICSSNNNPIIFGQTNQNDVFTNIAGATITERLRIEKNGNIGIGTPTPGFPLSFPNSLGDKIGLWGQSGNHYGLGIQSGLLQIHTDVAGSDIAFGYGSSAAMNETMRIKGNGNVGIGINPDYKLHVNGTVSLGGFTTNDADEWPNVVWIRNTDANWDEGLIKGSSTRGVFKRSGYGIHMHSSRHFCFYSSGWDPLVDIEGGTGRMYIKGNVGVANSSPALNLDVQGSLGIKNGANWDHMYFIHDGGSAFIRAGGADNGLVFQVGNAATGTYGGQTYTTGMTIKPTGRVGIGTSDPRATLDVVGVTSLPSLSYAYLNRNGAGGPGTWANVPVSIYASSRVVAEEFEAVSDRRLKTDIEKSDPAADLQSLAELEVCEYRFTEFDRYTSEKKKGFIAQQVQNIFPAAVSKQVDFIPSIYALPQKVELLEGVLTITMEEVHHLNDNSLLRLVTEKGNKQVPVSIIDERRFAVEAWDEETTNVFVYGTQVDDFLTLNYDYLFCSGISAIQELNRQVQQLKKELSLVTEKLFATMVPVH